MKSIRLSLILFLTIAGCLLTVKEAKADSTLSFSLLEPNQSGDPGDVLTFSATVANPSDSAVVMYLNSDSFNLDSPLIMDDSPYNNNPDFWVLNPGDSYTGVLFNVDIPSDTSPGAYMGSFFILGEIDPVGTGNSGATNTLASADFDITVTPEPSSYLLFGTGLAVLAGAFRRRLVHLPALH
jgi:hypothetical protein